MPAPKSAKKSTPVKATGNGLKKGDHVFLVDGSGYIFRAYHALPPLNRKSDGLQVNAVLGFCNMLWKLLRDMKPEDKPTHLAVVFDKSEKTFRTDFYPDYKAHRPDAPADLIPQFPLIREAVHAFDIPCLEQAGYEADDLIATYARLACDAGASATIVSSDKDLMQLVTDCVIMYDTMKDKKIGIAEVIEKFGVPPEKVIEVQSLIGDSTDNVPGVPGIGVKTAAQLIGEYGDLETLLSRASEIKQEKRRQTLIDNAELARISRRLVTLDQNVDLDVPVEDLAVHEPDYRKLVAFLKAMEFSTLTRRVGEAAEIDISQVEANAKLVSGAKASQAEAATPGAARTTLALEGGAMNDKGKTPSGAPAQGAMTPVSLAEARLAKLKAIPFDRSKYEVVRDLARLKAWIVRAIEHGHVAIDTETNSLDPMQAALCGFSLAVTPNEACYVPLAHKKNGGEEGLFDAGLEPHQIAEKDALETIKPLLEDPGVLKIGQNLKFDWQIFAQRGITIAPYDDTLLMSYVVDAGRSDHGLGPLARRYFDHNVIDYNEVTKAGKTRVTFDCVEIGKAAEYAAEDADVTLRLWHALKPQARRRAHDPCLRDIGTPDGGSAGAHGRARHLDRPADASRNCRASSATNPCGSKPKSRSSPVSRSIRARRNSSATYCSASMGLPGGTKTKTGQWSTGAKVLEDLAEQGHKLPQAILDWRQVSKLKLNLYRRAAHLCPSQDAARAHLLFAGRHHHRAGCPPPSPICRTSRSAPRQGRKIRTAFVATPATSSSRPTTRRSNCGCWRTSPTSRSSGRPSRTASTFTP